MKLPDVDEMEALETLLQHENRLFQVFKEDYGKDHPATIGAGMRLAATMFMYDIKRFVDATPLLHDLHETVSRVHVYSKAIQDLMERVLERNDVKDKSDDSSILLNQTVSDDDDKTCKGSR